MKPIWFKAKTYGWGWYPATWQGWAIMFVFAIANVGNFIRFDAVSHSGSDTLINFIPQLVLSAIVLVVICYLFGEKPGWRWGGEK